MEWGSNAVAWGGCCDAGEMEEGSECFSHRIDEHIKHHHGRDNRAQGSRRQTII